MDMFNEHYSVLFAPPPNALYLVFYENVCEKESGIEGVAG